MIGLAIDAFVLMALLKAINDDDASFVGAFLLALGAAIGTALLAAGLAVVMGIAGIVVAALLAGAILGVAVSALYGVEIKRSFAIAGIFMVVHIGVGIGFELMLRS